MPVSTLRAGNSEMQTGLPPNHGLSKFALSVAELVPTLDGEVFLTDVQYEALHVGVASGTSVLVSAPTSTGKTLIGWWAIASAVASGGRAVYLVSHRALAKQKFEEAQRLFLATLFSGDRAAIVCATGDGVEDASGRKTNAPMAAGILVATYEKFLGCLSVGGPPRDLTDICFVCDKVQLIGDPNRGQSVELLLTLMRRSGWRQLVCLSAVLSEKDGLSLASWLDLRLIRNPTREKALRLECRSNTSVHTIAVAPGLVGDIQTDNVRRETSTIQIVFELLTKPHLAPVIIFCMRVDDTYDLYNDLIRTKTATINVSPPGSFELDEGLRKALCCRAAFHNAELSEEERLFVEERIAAGKADVVFATSTLAAGVNFPLGSAVFETWTRWNVERRIHEPIGRAEFQNMAGRVGRMGQAAAEGLVILCADGGSELNNARKLMDLGAQDELGNGIIPEDFGMLTLQLFAGKLCARRDDAFDMIASTLSAAHPWGRLAGAWVPYGAGLFSPHCMPMLPLLPAGSRNAAGNRAGGRVGVDLPSTTKSTEAKPATESTVEAKATMEGKATTETAMEGAGAGSESTMEAKATMEGKATTEAKPTSETAMEAKARSETAMEGEGAGSESTMEGKATTEANPTSETAMEAKAASAKAASAKATPAEAAPAKAASAKAAPAEADCGKAVIARVHNTTGAPAGKGRRSQRRTGCHNRHGGQTNCYLAHHDAHSITLSTPAFVNQTQRSYRGCNGAAQSRGVRRSARYVGRPAFSPIACPKGLLVPVGRTG